MFGALGDMAGLLKTARDLQGNMQRMQEQLAAKRFEGDAGGGMVRVTVDGKSTVLDVKIEPQAVQDVELLEDLVKAAMSAALAKAQDAMKAEMTAMTGGLNIPGLQGLLGGK